MSGNAGDDTHDAVSEAVWTVAAEMGLENVTLRAVAAQAGCTTGLIMHRFGSRAEVLVHACRTMYTRIVVRADAIERDSVTDAETLVEVLGAVLPLDHDRIDEVRVWLGFAATALVEPVLAEVHVSHNREWLDRISHLIATIQPAIADNAVRAAAKQLVATVNGVAALAVLDYETYSPRVQSRILRRATADALAALGVSVGGGVDD